MPTTPSFTSTYSQFVDDLTGTFPELAESLKSHKGIEEAEAIRRFRGLWRSRLVAVGERDAALFEAEGGCEVLQGVRITPALWKEVGDATHIAIWNYLSTLSLLSAAAADATEEDSFWDEEDFKKSMEEMMRHLKAAAEGAGAGGDGSATDADASNPFAAFAGGLGGLGDLGGLFEKLRDMATGFASAAGGEGGAGATGAAMPDFKIPERLFKGHIARMAREIAEEFKPEEFGISPEMLESQDPAKLFEFLQEIFTKNPAKLMTAAQKIGKKIQAKFQRGEIKRDEIIAEIEELMKEFSENEAFNSIFGQMGDMLKMSARATGNEGSERRRQVQERLRKKAAEKEAAKKAGAGAGATVGSTGVSSAAAAADAAAAELLAAETVGKRKGGSGGGGARKAK
jgi:hypothetical protein